MPFNYDSYIYFVTQFKALKKNKRRAAGRKEAKIYYGYMGLRNVVLTSQSTDISRIQALIKDFFRCIHFHS